MSKLFKLFAVAISAMFVLSGTGVAETIDDDWFFDIGVEIEAVFDLIVTIRNVSDNQIPNLETMAFAGASAATTQDPWVRCDQYLQVEYTSNYGSWGVRIVSDNETRLNALAPGWDVQYTAPLGDYYFAGLPMDVDGDDVLDTLGYAGLLRTDATDWSNPSYRVALAWQVAVAPVAGGPVLPTSAIVIHEQGQKLVDTGVGAYGEPWGWIGDKTVFAMGDAGGADIFDGDIYLGQNAQGDNMYNDNLIAFGSGAAGGSSNGHPAGLDLDGDVAVYLSGRWANTDWADDMDPFVFGLGAGNYGTRLMVELINE